MAQRCGMCGKTEKQHQGKACLDTEGFARILKLKQKEQESETYRTQGTFGDGAVQGGRVRVLLAAETAKGNKGNFEGATK